MITKFSPIPEGFFGENGLTATSADHVANLLKMKYEEIESSITAINFVEEKLTIIGSGTENTTKRAYLVPLEDIVSLLEKSALCKGFIAFLREAVKAKAQLTTEIDNYISEDASNIIKPVPERALTEEEQIVGLSVADRVSYLAMDARAATIGKYIHPGGALAEARDSALEAIKEPSKVAMAGRDTVIITRESTCAITEIDKIISKLQAIHRESCAQVNGIKHDLEQKRIRDAQEKMDAYKKAMAEYQKKLDDAQIAVEQAKIERRKVIEGLKIVIPKKYMDLYKEVSG